ncbi:hypothetical protein HBH56_229550 [Parastagonospora nodorum]|uniref:Uncharacterized protein n=1 Tax=Phaeosphaeria nodorum (strain SN15 / ATCC MYA-4574 / FGSC 10173) TaxID=321614 RepID=A0A7U2I6J4_PHANO|nr:hypothetical protein HBH56_229550 [Parastagonospora nodorum]QRD03650.1 hypothetical protein JI435_420040 [Parastagonospora nodorum SN15]KAH3921817.1 hypothetical protein HBH54_233200 [Parastagonospora nodorum]KAH3960908.1 hypothetical protein HBH52_234830 [Parastagonospora nodorum]KAH4125498.1 hypothetical protein HBH45_229450 [Parastagonospora nodorum]
MDGKGKSRTPGSRLRVRPSICITPSFESVGYVSRRPDCGIEEKRMAVCQLWISCKALQLVLWCTSLQPVPSLGKQHGPAR